MAVPTLHPSRPVLTGEDLVMQYQDLTLLTILRFPDKNVILSQDNKKHKHVKQFLGSNVTMYLNNNAELFQSKYDFNSSIKETFSYDIFLGKLVKTLFVSLSIGVSNVLVDLLNQLMEAQVLLHCHLTEALVDQV